MNPGEIYWADLPAGRRPLVIVSREVFNRGTYVQAVPFTTVQFALRSTLPNCVPFKAGEFGLPRDCVAQCEMLTASDVVDLDSSAGIIGVLDEFKWRDLVRATGFVFCAECEPE